MYRILKFINKHADAIKSIRGNEILVTTSAWSEKSMQDRYNFNYYKDSCVTKAGGKSGGTIVLGFLLHNMFVFTFLYDSQLSQLLVVL